MPENDRFDLRLAPGWRTSFKYARNNAASDLEVTDSLVRSLAKAFRVGGGVPGFIDMLGIVTGFSPGGLLQGFGLLDAIVQVSEGHQHTKVAADVARSFLVQMDAGLESPPTESMPLQFSERVCSALLGNQFFAISRTSLQELRQVASLEDARQWQARIEQTMQSSIEELAARLLRRPDGQELRAPKRQLGKSTTSELLAENLVSIHTSEPRNPR